jgi:nucleotide sugar dehydrogenase
MPNSRVCVIGLGFVGSAIAATWLRAGASVVGYDASSARISLLREGGFTTEEKIADAFVKGLNSSSLTLTDVEVPALLECELKFVCVPVYQAEDKNADLSVLKSACESVGRKLKKTDAVIICSSVPPGTTRNVLCPILEASSGLKAGEDFSLIYSPERIFVGRAVDDIEERYPTIISGIDTHSLDAAERIFRTVAKKGVIRMQSLEGAELEKLFEGVYRDVNIALANELALICGELNVDFWSVREAANSQPFSHIHVPGFGVGGACIPVYPWFVAKSVRKNATRLIVDSRVINDSMVDWLVEALKEKFQRKSSTRVGVLGLAFRADVPDARNSPTYRLVTKLKEQQFSVVGVHDPIIKNDGMLGDLLTNDLERILRESNVVILVTDHSCYKQIQWDKISRARKEPLVVIDGKGILRGISAEGIEILVLGQGNQGLAVFEHQPS